MSLFLAAFIKSLVMGIFPTWAGEDMFPAKPSDLNDAAGWAAYRRGERRAHILTLIIFGVPVVLLAWGAAIVWYEGGFSEN